ncbi:hypothetical protein BDW42DRAFT_95710 [Aspergillus taichungensis]|uniref:Uncharacterized protein n=1 Tax=Aspergillus taichungensis TaxID=482145 RepID=A0A2J5HVN8_9EURO|nr:hypothetical protein BDW42DRAFT_95710 [Aspergillus taichungensis]
MDLLDSFLLFCLLSSGSNTLHSVACGGVDPPRKIGGYDSIELSIGVTRWGPMGPLMDFGNSYSQEIQTKWESIINDVLKHVKPLPRPACFVIHSRVWGRSRLITSCADRRLFPDSSFIARRYPLLKLAYIKAINSGERIPFSSFSINPLSLLILRGNLSSTKVLRLKVSTNLLHNFILLVLLPLRLQLHPLSTPTTTLLYQTKLSTCTPTPPPASSSSSPLSRLVPPPSPPPTSPLLLSASAPAASPRQSRWAPRSATPSPRCRKPSSTWAWTSGSNLSNVRPVGCLPR